MSDLSKLKDVLRAANSARSLEGRAELAPLLKAITVDARKPEVGLDRAKEALDGFSPSNVEAKSVAQRVRVILGIASAEPTPAPKEPEESAGDEERSEKFSRDRIERKGRNRSSE